MMPKIKGSERNDFCPTCGKKMKLCQGHRRLANMSIAIIATAATMVLLLSIFITLRGVGKGAMSVENRPLKKIIQLYLKEHQHEDSWWLLSDEENNVSQTVEATNKAKTRIAKLIKKYASLNPLTEKIGENFQRLDVSIYLHGISRFIIEKNDPDPPSPDKLEICFIPRDQMSNQPSRLWYNQDWRALMVAAINYPNTVFSAVLLHELGHAFSHRVENNFAAFKGKPDSDAWVKEEISMHELEQDVLNAATGGKFFQYIDGLLVKSKTHDFRELLIGLRNENLLALDKIIQCDHCGSDIAGTVIAEYFVALGFRFIDRLAAVTDKTREKIRLYRFIETNLVI